MLRDCDRVSSALIYHYIAIYAFISLKIWHDIGPKFQGCSAVYAMYVHGVLVLHFGSVLCECVCNP